ncbi:lytic transglycosylase domain-containing protein (plasmid) [Agrobacterium sp. rho-13.3]|uniref:lytic transglycosylase domain-containing protein n=1 Tax=Agrobacterium sp. rho-13.3 TaxID=3072980 RepID=UPI002A13020D|nr:lytic transglycosylase domain-containing protein [Agrobacterium sp. rho-13.3]MDX8311535.1 lytic transglycosylase domain-containing protein [Agrobacterium sp. rho-13.3]
MLEFFALAAECAPAVAPQTMAAIVQTESTFNPYAIGVVGGRLQRQPRSLQEAVEAATALEAGGWNFSVGLAQVNRHNFKKYGLLTYAQAFEPCANLRAGSLILAECYTRAFKKMRDRGPQTVLQASFSCYYSGNFTRGFKPDRRGDPSYVQKVLAQADVKPRPIQVVPAVVGVRPPRYDKAASPAAEVSPALAATPGDNPPSLPVSLPPPDHTSVLIELQPRVSRSDDIEPATSVTPADADAAQPVRLKITKPEKPAQQVTGDVVIF